MLYNQAVENSPDILRRKVPKSHLGPFCADLVRASEPRINDVVLRDLSLVRRVVADDYKNMAMAGFFRWIAAHYPAMLIFVECKNYDGEVSNPELDQLAGRFSRERGQVGFLVARQIKEKPRFLERARDTARDGRGFILPLDDSDLADMVQSRKANAEYQAWPLLHRIFKQLIS